MVEFGFFPRGQNPSNVTLQTWAAQLRSPQVLASNATVCNLSAGHAFFIAGTVSVPLDVCQLAESALTGCTTKCIIAVRNSKHKRAQ